MTPLTADPGYLLTPTGTLYYVVGSCHNAYGLLIRVAKFSHIGATQTVTLITWRPNQFKRILAGAERVREPTVHPTTGADLAGAKKRLAERLAALPERR